MLLEISSDNSNMSSSHKGGDSRAREEIHLAIYEFNVGS